LTFSVGFELMALDELLTVWENREHLLGAVYWLSQGRSWLELNGQAVPTTHPDWLARNPGTGQPVGIEYPVLRLLTDLGEVMSAWVSPLPPVLAGAVEGGAWDGWQKTLTAMLEGLPDDDLPETSALWEMAGRADGWWRARRLDTGYLRVGPECIVWSTDPDTVNIRWDTSNKRIEGVLALTETAGEYRLARTDLLRSVSAFRDSLTTALTARILEVEQRGLTDSAMGDALRLQLQRWLHDVERGLSRTSEDEWPETLAAIRELEPLVGPLL